MPVYNVADYVAASIESVLNQTFTDFELIIVNDGSTDDSEHVITKYVNLDSRIRYFNNENKGIAEARNFGIKKTIGEYVYFIDSDDIIDESLLLRAVSRLESTNSDALLFDYVFIDKFNNPIGGSLKIASSENELTSQQALDLLFYGKMEHHIWSLLVKADIYKKNNIIFPIGRNYEDVGTKYKLLACSKKICLFPDRPELYYYRMRDDSIVHTVSIQNINDIWANIPDAEKYFLTRKNDIPKSFYSFSLNELVSVFIFYQRFPDKYNEVQVELLKQINKYNKTVYREHLSIKKRIVSYLLKMKMVKISRYIIQRS